MTVLDADGVDTVTVHRGWVHCRDFPPRRVDQQRRTRVPPPFLRRCSRVELSQPGCGKLQAIVEAHLPAYLRSSDDIIQQVLERQSAESSLLTNC